mgnify:CR=1 FL=1
MCEEELKTLQALLFGDRRELLDIKFFPGEAPCTCGELLTASAEMLVKAMSGDALRDLPQTTRRATRFGDIVGELV